MTYTDNHPKFNCPCGLTERIEQRIKFLEADNERLKGTNFSSFMNNNDIRINELKDLLKDLPPLLALNNITESNTVIQNKHIFSDENGMHMEDRDKE